MGVEDLGKKILADAEDDVKAIESSLDEQVAEIRERLTEQAKTEADAIIARGSSKAELVKKEIIGNAKVNARVVRLSRKRELLEEFFTEVSRVIEGLPDSDKKRILKSLMGDADALGKDPVFFVAKEYVKLVDVKAGVRVGDFNDFGVVIESKDGLRRVDNRLGQILSDLKARQEHNLNKILWG